MVEKTVIVHRAVTKVPKPPDYNRSAVPQIWTSGPALRTSFVRKLGRSSEDVVLLNGYKKRNYSRGRSPKVK